MNLATQLAKHFRDSHFGGNWTDVNLKDTLTGVDWHLAMKKTGDLNTIAKLTFHIHYFVEAMLSVLRGNGLHANDKFSFDLPEIHSEEQWQELLHRVFEDAEEVSNLIAQLPDEKLYEDFTYPKYGSYLRNILGTIEHTHYHLGQIALLKKILKSESSN